MTYINNHAFVKAVRYIYDNIDQPINLDEISNKIGLSTSSLKRLFKEALKQSPGVFIRHLRMELAFRSIQSRQDSILEVALSSGFEDQSAFARSFKETFGYSPSEARKKLNLMSELESITLDEPDIVEIADLIYQAVTEKGLYMEAAATAWAHLKEKLTTQELGDDFAGLFIGIGHDNPHEGEVAPDQVRFSAGVTLCQRDIGLTKVKIPGGSYARFRYLGTPVNLGLAYHYIYGKWAEDSGHKINEEIPAFIAFDCFPEAFKEHHLLIHVPLA